MSEADEFVAANPALARAMAASRAFPALRDAAALDIDEERLYIVRGDTLGSEADLFVEALVRGARGSDPTDPARALYLELDDETRVLVERRIGRQPDEGGPR